MGKSWSFCWQGINGRRFLRVARGYLLNVAKAIENLVVVHDGVGELFLELIFAKEGLGSFCHNRDL